MGPINGKQFQISNQDYFQQQIELYRWRADNAYNEHIPKVYFSSKLALINRSKLQNLLQEQLATLNYVDINSIADLTAENRNECQEEVMTFENYQATLALLEQKLNLEETLFVLQALLRGYQTILRKMYRVFVSQNCCFVTQKGEVRAWINPNHTLNQFPLNSPCETSEPATINLILALCGSLCLNSNDFHHFRQQLNRFMGYDILHNINFSSIRKFINGYLYTQCIKLPNNLTRPLASVRLSGRSTSFQSVSSLSEFVESPPSQNQLESRVTNLTKSSQPNYSRLSLSSTPSSNFSNKQFQFYQPHQKPVRKLSQLEPPQYCKTLNHSEVMLKKSVEASISSSFNKKRTLHQQNMTFTPKHQIRTRCHLESTAGESFVQLSKDPSGLIASKLLQSSSASNQMDNSNSLARLGRAIHYCSGPLTGGPPTKDIHKMQTQTHSKQPSFDQNSSTIFLSPPNHFPRRNQPRTKIDTVSESEQAEEEESSVMGPASTSGQVYPSQMLNRQVSGLVSNAELHLCQSQGSFISLENSSASEYHGELLRLGRSAKMLAVPSNRRIEVYARSTMRHPHPTR